MQPWILPYCIVAVGLVVALVFIIRSSVNRRIEMSRTSRVVRVVCSIGLAIAFSGIAFAVWELLGKRQ